MVTNGQWCAAAPEYRHGLRLALGGEIERARALEGVARVAQVLEEFLKKAQPQVWELLEKRVATSNCDSADYVYHSNFFTKEAYEARQDGSRNCVLVVAAMAIGWWADGGATCSTLRKRALRFSARTVKPY